MLPFFLDISGEYGILIIYTRNMSSGSRMHPAESGIRSPDP